MPSETEPAPSCDAPSAAQRSATLVTSCVIDIWKDGITVNDGDLFPSPESSQAAFKLLSRVSAGLCAQSGLVLADDAEITIHGQPTATYEATQLGLKTLHVLAKPEEDRKIRDEDQAELVRYGVTPDQARLVLMNELDKSSFRQVESIFKQIKKDRKDYPIGPSFNLPGATGRRVYVRIIGMYITPVVIFALILPLLLPMYLLVGRPGLIKPVWTSCWKLKDATTALRWIKAPLKMIEQAAQTGEALCVSRSGKFKLLSSGYTALSHVDGETFGWLGLKGHERVPEDKRGLNREHLNRIFGAIKRAEDEWVWLDNLAIPAYLSAKVKADAINKMPMIYSNAKTVLILDALTMQLKTTSLTDVAVVLVCGKWITRAWCYQEIKLANFENVFILVSDGRASVDSMFQQLQLLAPNDESLFVRLFRTFNRLRMPVTELSLADIAGACQNRRAGLDEDYARAFFPTLGMQWKSGWNRELGMVEIYKARPAQAAQFATLHGPRGLPDSWGWAAAYLCGLEGERRHDLTINDNGQLVGEWYSIEVVEHEKSFRWGQNMVVHNLKARTPGENNIAKVQISTRTGAQLRSSYAEQVQLDEKQTA